MSSARRWQRSARGIPPGYAERLAQARRQRARAHLERVRRRSQRPSGPRRGVLAALAALAVAAGFAVGVRGVLAAARFAELTGIPVRTIGVQGAVTLTASQVARASGVAPGTPMVELDLLAIEERLRSQPWILEANALPLPPDRLLLSVREREPVAVVVLEGGVSAHVVDADGLPFAPARPAEISSLPHLIGGAGVEPGRASEALAAAVRASRALAPLGLPAAAELRIADPADPEGLTLRLRGHEARILLGAGDPTPKLRRLARLFAADLPEVERAAFIDLRFADLAVLRSAPSPKGRAKATVPRGRAAPPTHGPARVIRGSEIGG